MSFNTLQDHATSVIETLDDPGSAAAAAQIHEDDDISLLRLGGWALFSCIKYRAKSVKGKSKIKHTVPKKETHMAELQVLRALVDTVKEDLPIGITALDRGYMTFPCKALLPYIQTANKTIKDCVNGVMYKKYGSKLLEVSVPVILLVHACTCMRKANSTLQDCRNLINPVVDIHAH